MARVDQLTVQAVDKMPDVLEDGILYVAEPYRLALHNCCCGCGEEVATPLGPTEYQLRIDGGRATLRPSIGNHDFVCRSHYFIRAGRVVWAGAMSRDEIEAGRQQDRRLKRYEKLSWRGRLIKRLSRLWPF